MQNATFPFQIRIPGESAGETGMAGPVLSPGGVTPENTPERKPNQQIGFSAVMAAAKPPEDAPPEAAIPDGRVGGFPIRINADAADPKGGHGDVGKDTASRVRRTQRLAPNVSGKRPEAHLQLFDGEIPGDVSPPAVDSRQWSPLPDAGSENVPRKSTSLAPTADNLSDPTADTNTATGLPFDMSDFSTAPSMPPRTQMDAAAVPVPDQEAQQQIAGTVFMAPAAVWPSGPVAAGDEAASAGAPDSTAFAAPLSSGEMRTTAPAIGVSMREMPSSEPEMRAAAPGVALAPTAGMSPQPLPLAPETAPLPTGAPLTDKHAPPGLVVNPGPPAPAASQLQGAVAEVSTSGSEDAVARARPLVADIRPAPGEIRHPLEMKDQKAPNLILPAGQARPEPGADPTRQKSHPEARSTGAAPDDRRLEVAPSSLAAASGDAMGGARVQTRAQKGGPPDFVAPDDTSRPAPTSVPSGETGGAIRQPTASMPIMVSENPPPQPIRPDQQGIDRKPRRESITAQVSTGPDKASAAPSAPANLAVPAAMVRAPDNADGLAAGLVGDEMPDDQAPAAELLSGFSGAPQVSAGTAPPPGEPALARHVGTQLADLARTPPGGPVELTLSPEELGKVRLVFHHDNGHLAVQLTTERPETMDLMRRNIETLAQELRNIGYREVSFGFGAGQGGQGSQHGFSSGGETPARAGSGARLPADAPVPIARPGPKPKTDTSIDIRL